jgi:hypothetical protein
MESGSSSKALAHCWEGTRGFPLRCAPRSPPPRSHCSTTSSFCWRSPSAALPHRWLARVAERIVEPAVGAAERVHQHQRGLLKFDEARCYWSALPTAPLAVDLLNTPEVERATEEHVLDKFGVVLEPNPRAIKRLVIAYGIERSVRTLEGNVVPRDTLVLWTILNTGGLTWLGLVSISWESKTRGGDSFLRMEGGFWSQLQKRVRRSISGCRRRHAGSGSDGTGALSISSGRPAWCPELPPESVLCNSQRQGVICAIGTRQQGERASARSDLLKSAARQRRLAVSNAGGKPPRPSTQCVAASVVAFRAPGFAILLVSG